MAQDPDGRFTKATYSETVRFPTPFPYTPTVALALNRIWMTDPNGNQPDSYGWQMEANGITTWKFDAALIMDDYEIKEMYISWIACVTL